MSSMGGMMRRMHRMPGVEVPTSEERRAIVAYLEEHAMAAIAEAQLEMGDAAAAVFADTCDRCHALPDPAQHTAEEWPGVVVRMRANMERMGVAGITDEEAQRIVEYLQRNARGQAPEVSFGWSRHPPAQERRGT